jgi:hypothetical protein
MLIVQAGMNDIDRRCDAWLTWLDDKARSSGPIHQQILLTQTATTAILGATLANPVTAVTVVGAAFGFAASTFSNVHSRLVFQLEKSTVQKVVLQRQQDYRSALPTNINNKPAAIYALRQYLRLCMPMTIETEVNTTVKLFESGGAEALRRSRPMIDGRAVDTAVIRSATAPMSKPIRAPIIADPIRVGAYEARLLPSTIRDFQRLLCRTEDGRFTATLREEILQWLRDHKRKDGKYPDRITAVDGTRLRTALDSAPNC